MNKIIVNNKYTFLCDFKVKKRQNVVLPTPEFLKSVQGPTWIGKVTDTKSHSDYSRDSGDLDTAISIATPSACHQDQIQRSNSYSSKFAP